MRLIGILLTFLCSLVPAFAGCDPHITLNVARPFGSEAEPTVVAATAISGCTITAISVYVDYKLIYQQRGINVLDGRLIMGGGPHRVAIVAQNSAGAAVKAVSNIVSVADPVEPIAGCEGSLPIEYTGDHIPFPAKSPVRVGMLATSESAPISTMLLYIDGVSRIQIWGSTARCLPVALLPLKTGTHFINVEARDALGHISLTGSIMQVVH